MGLVVSVKCDWPPPAPHLLPKLSAQPQAENHFAGPSWAVGPVLASIREGLCFPSSRPVQALSVGSEAGKPGQLALVPSNGLLLGGCKRGSSGFQVGVQGTQ